MADLTRFDFHAKRFYFSEHVRVMTAEEVGQYLLLLVESWMGGKDASLPDNTTLLARYARVPVVSELVLKMFPVIETDHGARRRNPTLFEEWSKAVQRTEDAKSKAAARWSPKDPEAEAVEQPKQCTGNAAALLLQSKPTVTAYAHTIPLPIQAGSGPGRSGSEPKPESESEPQSNDDVDLSENNSFDSSPNGATAPNPVKSDFKSFRRTWRHVVGKKLSGNKMVVSKYTLAAQQFDHDTIVAALNEWAQAGTLKWAQEAAFPFGAFIKVLPGIVDELKEDADIEAEEQRVQQLPPENHEESVNTNLVDEHVKQFQDFCAVWKELFGFDLPYETRAITKHKQAVKEYGAERVAERLRAWHPTNAWVRNTDTPVSMAYCSFFKTLPYSVREDVTVDQQMETAEALAEIIPAEPVDQAVVDESIRRAVAEEQRKRAERVAKFAKPVDEDATSALDYL